MLGSAGEVKDDTLSLLKDDTRDIIRESFKGSGERLQRSRLGCPLQKAEDLELLSSPSLFASCLSSHPHFIVSKGPRCRLLEIVSESLKIPTVLNMIEHSTSSLLASQQIPPIYISEVIRKPPGVSSKLENL